MKQFVIQPTMKKSVVEVRTFKKVTDEGTQWLRYEDCYRWGGFVLCVPETDEEKEDWAKHQGELSFKDWCEAYDEDPATVDIQSYCLPSSDEDPVMIMEDWGWNAEMIETWDGGCWTEWTVSSYGENKLTEEECEEEAERLSELYYDEYEEGLEAEGWEEVDVDWLIYNEFKITEVPEGESPYDIYEG